MHVHTRIPNTESAAHHVCWYEPSSGQIPPSHGTPCPSPLKLSSGTLLSPTTVGPNICIGITWLMWINSSFKQRWGDVRVADRNSLPCVLGVPLGPLTGSVIYEQMGEAARSNPYEPNKEIVLHIHFRGAGAGRNVLCSSWSRSPMDVCQPWKERGHYCLTWRSSITALVPGEEMWLSGASTRGPKCLDAPRQEQMLHSPHKAGSFWRSSSFCQDTSVLYSTVAEGGTALIGFWQWTLTRENQTRWRMKDQLESSCDTELWEPQERRAGNEPEKLSRHDFGFIWTDPMMSPGEIIHIRSSWKRILHWLGEDKRNASLFFTIKPI